MWLECITGVACSSSGSSPNQKKTVDHVVNTVYVNVRNVQQHVCKGFSGCGTGEVGVDVRDSWQCELWLNYRRECTERLETVGVKKSCSAFFNQSYGPDSGLVFRHSSMYCLWPMLSAMLFSFLFHKPCSHHIQPSANEDVPPLQTADEALIVFA